MFNNKSSNCYSASNNIHSNFPALMSDSRTWTSWQPESVINERIQQSEGIKTNWQYRQYLQQNSEQIMQYNNLEACYDLGLDATVQTGKTPTNNVPHKYRSTFDDNHPIIGYNNSDLKTPYLSREQLNARMISPSIHYNS